MLTTHVGSLPRSPRLTELLLRQERGEVVDEAELEQQAETAVERILQLRLDADYRLKGVSHIQATRAVRLAEEFVAAITTEVTHGGYDPDIP